MLTTKVLFHLSYSSANKKLLNAAKDNTEDLTSELEKALEKGADINVTDIRIKNAFNIIGYRYTALMWAAYNGHLNKVKFLIDKKADVFATSGHGNTALHIAAREGHAEIVNFLSNLYPMLLKVKGENNQIPYEVAVVYGKSRKVVEVFENHYSNPFFGPIKNQLPREIALFISQFINDPITLKNLSLTNKAWHHLSKDKLYEEHYQKAFKSYLPGMFKTFSWEIIFKHYFPSEPVPEDAFKSFIKRIHTYYFIGDAVNVLIDKSRGEKLGEEIISLPFLIANWVDEFPASKKYRDVCDQEK